MNEAGRNREIAGGAWDARPAMHPSLLSQARVLINLLSHQHETPLPVAMVDQLARLLGVAAMRGPEGLSGIVENAVSEACAPPRGVVS